MLHFLDKTRRDMQGFESLHDVYFFFFFFFFSFIILILHVPRHPRRGQRFIGAIFWIIFKLIIRLEFQLTQLIKKNVIK